MGIAFAVGVYDGFYGPGTGTFLMLMLTGLAHLRLDSAAGVTKSINTPISLSFGDGPQTARSKASKVKNKKQGHQSNVRKQLIHRARSQNKARKENQTNTPASPKLTNWPYATKSQTTFTKKTSKTTMVIGRAIAPPFLVKL